MYKGGVRYTCKNISADMTTQIYECDLSDFLNDESRRALVACVSVLRYIQQAMLAL